jgi:hypothetical protein
MPERWQHELEKLRTVGAPSSMRTRIDAGPAGNGVPPMPGRRQRVVAGVVAFAVFGGAIALAWGAFGRSGGGATIAEPGPPQEAAVFTFLAHQTDGGADPTGTMVFGDVTVEAFGTSFCWDFGGGSMCADTIQPEFADADFGIVAAATPIAIEGDAESVEGHVDAAGTASFDRIRPLGTSGNSAALPSEPGRYVIEFDVTWSQGERSFFFPIRIVDASAPDPSILVATMSAPADGSVPGLTLTYGDTTKEFFAQGGSWPGFAAYDDSRQVFPVAIAPGTSLRIEGNVRNWVVDVRRDDAPESQDFGSTDGDPIPLGEPGDYLFTFKGVWAEGTVAFPVQIMVRDMATAPSPNEPSTPSSGTLPDLVGMTDQNAMKTLDDLGLAWLVAYRAVDGERWRVVEMNPPAGSAITKGLEVRLVVATEITPLPAGAEDILACPAAEHVAFGGPHAVILPLGEAFIRGNTGGIERTDDVTQISSDWSSELWQVIRDGAVIAIVDYRTLDGVACAGSGVAGA